MDELLTPVSRTYKSPPAPEQDFIVLSQLKATHTPAEVKFKAQSPEEALEALKSQPSYDKLIAVLRYLRKGIEGQHDFNVQQPGPQSAQIVHLLVSEIAPNYWALLKADASTGEAADLEGLLVALRSVTGINSLTIYLKALLKEAQSDPKGIRNTHVVANLQSTQELLSTLLAAEDTVGKLWIAIKTSKIPAQSRTLRQDLIGLLTNNKITSLSAEADFFLRQVDKTQDDVWTSSTRAYIDWLLRSVVSCLTKSADSETEKFCADTLSRAMKLTHSGERHPKSPSDHKS